MRIAQDGPGNTGLEKPTNPIKAHKTAIRKLINHANQHITLKINLTPRPVSQVTQISLHQTGKVTF